MALSDLSETKKRVGPSRLEPEASGVPRISFRCTDLLPVPAARQLGLGADSDRPQAEPAKALSGPERVLPSYNQLDEAGQKYSVHVGGDTWGGARDLLNQRSPLPQLTTVS